MELTERVDLDAEPNEVFAVVEDLGRYPDWLTIVPRAVPDISGDSTDVWLVDLRGRLGPLSRAKRLRMERTHHEPPNDDTAGRVRFERAEQDGRQHSPWVLDAEVEPDGAGTVLTMRLRYGGSLWVPMLDRLLRQEIERSRPRLAALLSA